MVDLPKLSDVPVVQSGGTKAKPLKIDEPYLHIHPKTKGLYFRRTFPARLRPHILSSLTELKVSLESKTVLDAGVAERFWAASREYDVLYARALKTKDGVFDRLEDHDIIYLAKVFEQEALADDEASRWAPEERNIYNSVAEQLSAQGIGYDTPWRGQEQMRWEHRRRETLERTLAIKKALRANGDMDGIVEFWQEEAELLAEANGYVLDPADTDGLARLCRAVNDASISAAQGALNRLDGEVHDNPPVPVLPKAPEVAAAIKATGRTFRQIVEEMLGNSRFEIGGPTRAQVATALRYLGDVLGDLRPEELTKSAVGSWLDVIKERPAIVSAAERVMPLTELVALYAGKDVKRTSPGTLEKHCGVLSKRWSHAVQEGYIPETLSNPFAGRSFGKAKSGPKEVDGFSPEELQAIFSLPFFTGGPQPRWGKGETAFWLPLLALYTGARPEELAQLVLANIYPDHETGRLVLDFAGVSAHPEKGQQRLKTQEKGTGPRVFAVHADLIELGFVHYVEWLRGQGEEALFPKLRVRNKFNRLFPSIGEKWSEAIYSAGILERHSGRKPMRCPTAG